MSPVQTIARRRLLAGLVGLPAVLVAIPGQALALVSPKRDHYLAIYREWMRPRLPYLQRRDALSAAERAAREAHAAAEAVEITMARAMIRTPSPSPKATAYKMELATSWRFRGIAWATTAHLAERTTRAEVVALADRAG